MIGRLRGTVDGRGENWVLIDVGGVGYMVEGSARLLQNLPISEKPVTLAIETHMREDQLRLFGFLSERERSWFRALLRVQGVGAKAALAVQSVLSVDELAHAVAVQDKQMVGRASGVGPKLAQRIVQELKDKMPEVEYKDGHARTQIDNHQFDNLAPDNRAIEESLSALVNLGYPRAAAYTAICGARQRISETEGTPKTEPNEKDKGGDGTISTPNLIRFALQELAR